MSIKNETVPSWFDLQLIENGCNFYKKYMFSVYVSCLTGLIYLFATPVASVLNFTGKTGSPFKAFKRFYKTLMLMDSWYSFSNWDENNKAYKSLTQLRKLHESIAQQINNQNTPDVNFSQNYLALAQFAFMGPLILFPHKLGIWCTKQELEGLIHLWRVVGYTQGLEEKFNLCSGSHSEVIEKCEKILQSEIIPALKNPSPYFHDLSYNLIEGVRFFVPFLRCDASVKFSYKLANVAHCKNLTGYEFFIYWLQRCTCEFFLYFTIVRSFLNNKMKQALKYASGLYKTQDEKKRNIRLNECCNENALSMKACEMNYNK